MKKKMLGVVLLVMLICSMTACGNDNRRRSNSSVQKNASGEQAVKENSKILVAYFTRADNMDQAPRVDAVSRASFNVENGEVSGNTEAVAKYIQEAVGGDLFSIKTVEPYPLNYDDNVNVASEEQKNNARPKLSTHVENMDKYDVIFIGYPNWWGTLPKPVFTFLEEYNLSGKTVIPFATHRGSGLGSGPRDISKLSPNSKILDGFSVRGEDAINSKDDVNEWLKDLGVLK